MEILNAVFGNLGDRKKQQEFEQVRDRITTESEDDHLVAGGEKAEDAEPGAAGAQRRTRHSPASGSLELTGELGHGQVSLERRGPRNEAVSTLRWMPGQ